MKLPHGGFTPRIAGRPASNVEKLFLSDTLQINLERRGLKYLPVVKNGQKVGFGDSLAVADAVGGKLALPSPGSGSVSFDSDNPRQVILERVTQDVETERLTGYEPSRLSGEKMRKVLSDGGVWPFFWSSQSGGLPALDGSEQPKAIIVNFVLAEPFRARGKVTLVHSWENVIRGIGFLPRILADYGKIEIVLTAVNDPVAQRMYAELAGHAWIRLHSVPVIYPIENPQVLRQALRKAVPTYEPEDVIWTIDFQGIEALGSCLGEGLSLHRRMVTVNGPGARNPRHLSVRIGTPIRDVIGNEIEPDDVIVLRGGLLTGEVLDPASDSVSYDDDGFFILPKSKSREFLSFIRPGFNRTSCLPAFMSRVTAAADSHISDSIRGERRPCIACGLCEKVCPAYILPQILHRYLYREAIDEAEKAGLDRCMDCNLCTFVCPSKIELREQFYDAREQLREEHEEAQRANSEAGVESD